MKTVIGLGAMFIVLAIAIGALLALPVMWLWNGCLVGAIDGVKEVTYLQAWGLYILSHFLFKNVVSSSSKD